LPAGALARARLLHDELRSRGGFTLDHVAHAPLRSGVAVCADPSLAWCFGLEEWDDHRVAEWIAGLRHRLDQGDVHLGGWLHHRAASVWLELVWVLPERLLPAAMAIGRLHGQHAVFHLRRAELVALGGEPDGMSPR
jgi:hypothetical protein